MAGSELALTIPRKKVSAWVVETKPKEARAWLASLPMADTGEAARELYQALYTLNRLELSVQDRFRLMELYQDPVATVTSALQTHSYSSGFPFSSKRRQLAEFVRQLQMEMANGYKCVVVELSASRLLWGRKKLCSSAVELAMRYLGEVLNRSYHVYMPCPAGVWKEIHALYQFAEANDWFGEGGSSEDDVVHCDIYRRYLQIVLLGLCHPYQLPENEWWRIYQFLGKWATEAFITKGTTIANPAGQFLIDLTADAPPVPYSKDVLVEQADHLRTLSAIGITRTVQNFINRLKKGEPARRLDLGTECLDSACLDMLQRMMRFWGLAVRRQRKRTKKRGQCFVVTGINAVHFFAGNQKPFVSPVVSAGQKYSEYLAKEPNGPDPKAMASIPGSVDVPNLESESDSTFVDLGLVKGGRALPRRNKVGQLADPLLHAQEVYRIENWQVRDESSSGLSLVNKETGSSHHLRVGDLVGTKDIADSEEWRIGAVRWLKKSESGETQMGIEVLAPQVMPVAIGSIDLETEQVNAYTQALWLPPVSALRRPATLIVPRGLCRLKGALMFAEENYPPRRIIVLELLEQTGSFDHIVFADAKGHADQLNV